MNFFNKKIKLSTRNDVEFLNITDDVLELVEESCITNGLVNIISNHTTCGIRINENCERLQQDMTSLFNKLSPKDESYKHNEATMDGRLNAHSHLMTLVTGSTETIPLKNGELMLGQWQSIFFIEFDGPRSERSVIVSIIGE